MSMTRGPVDLSADQQEEACVAFGMQPYSLKMTQANNFSRESRFNRARIFEVEIDRLAISYHRFRESSITSRLWPSGQISHW